MIRLKSDLITLEDDIKKVLEKKQKTINDLSTFTEKSIKAGKAWESKGSPDVFRKIKTHLISLCVSVEICNYCESNEANDIEHIFPKKLFPHRTFVWKNYLLACQNCNSKYKQDRFAIFDPLDSASVTEYVSRQKVDVAPNTEDNVFINPREENPMDFLWLDLTYGIFNIHPNFLEDENSRGYKKAEQTLKILKLNKREKLVAGRKAARKEYLHLLEEYIDIKKATNFEELKEAVHNCPEVNERIPFVEEQQNIIDSTKKQIKTHRHPTVWYELIRQRAFNPFFEKLFSEAPEAILW
jgi:uncharacterized protein (TIGR02646 family)